MDEQLLLWSTARILPQVLINEVPWVFVGVDAGTMHGARMTQVLALLRLFSVRSVSRTHRSNLPCLCAVAEAAEACDLHELVQLVWTCSWTPTGFTRGGISSLEAGLMCEAAATGVFLAQIERYSLGDAAVQRWAVEDFVPAQLRAVLRCCVRVVRNT